jgi:hypothetical protein
LDETFGEYGREEREQGDAGIPCHRGSPGEVICTRPPDTPSSLKMKKPSVTKPMCEMDE